MLPFAARSEIFIVELNIIPLINQLPQAVASLHKCPVHGSALHFALFCVCYAQVLCYKCLRTLTTPHMFLRKAPSPY